MCGTMECGPIGTNQIVLPCSISPVGIITSTLFPKNKIVIVEGKSNKGSRNIFELNRGIHETCVVKPNMNEVFDCTIIPVSIIHINYNTWIIIFQAQVRWSIDDPKIPKLIKNPIWILFLIFARFGLFDRLMVVQSIKFIILISYNL